MKSSNIFVYVVLFFCESIFALQSDINNDKRVDLLDLNILSKEWLQEEIVATYYVSPDGNNGSSGLTPNDAWQTISYAITTATSGSEILLIYGESGGIFAGFNMPNISDKTLTIKTSDPSPRAIIQASGAFAWCILLNSASISNADLTFEDIEFDANGQNDHTLYFYDHIGSLNLTFNNCYVSEGYVRNNYGGSSSDRTLTLTNCIIDSSDGNDIAIDHQVGDLYVNGEETNIILADGGGDSFILTSTPAGAGASNIYLEDITVDFSEYSNANSLMITARTTANTTIEMTNCTLLNTGTTVRAESTATATNIIITNCTISSSSNYCLLYEGGTHTLTVDGSSLRGSTPIGLPLIWTDQNLTVTATDSMFYSPGNTILQSTKNDTTSLFSFTDCTIISGGLNPSFSIANGDLTISGGSITSAAAGIAEGTSASTAGVIDAYGSVDSISIIDAILKPATNVITSIRGVNSSPTVTITGCTMSPYTPNPSDSNNIQRFGGVQIKQGDHASYRNVSVGNVIFNNNTLDLREVTNTSGTPWVYWQESPYDYGTGDTYVTAVGTITMQNNTCYNVSGITTVPTHATGVLIEDNTLYLSAENSSRGVSIGQEVTSTAGSEVNQNPLSGSLIIRDNTIIQTNEWVADPSAEEIRCHLILVAEGANYAEVYDNYCEGGWYGIVVKGDNGTYYNNTVISWDAFYLSGCANNTVYNNTIIGTYYPNDSRTLASGWAMSISLSQQVSSSNGHNVYNNILYATDNNNTSKCLYVYPAAAYEDNRFDYNCYYNAGNTGVISNIDGGTQSTLQELKDAWASFSASYYPNNDNNSVYKDPNFTNPDFIDDTVLPNLAPLDSSLWNAGRTSEGNATYMGGVVPGYNGRTGLDEGSSINITKDTDIYFATRTNGSVSYVNVNGSAFTVQDVNSRLVWDNSDWLEHIFNSNNDSIGENIIRFSGEEQRFSVSWEGGAHLFNVDILDFPNYSINKTYYTLDAPRATFAGTYAPSNGTGIAEEWFDNFINTKTSDFENNTVTSQNVLYFEDSVNIKLEFSYPPKDYSALTSSQFVGKSPYSSSDSKSEIYYTLNGKNPTIQSNIYKGEFTLSSNTLGDNIILKAMTVYKGQFSPVYKAEIVIV
jgi:hypothetical protein